MVTLRRLVIHARVNGWHARMWFKDATYKAPVLYLCHSQDVADMVNRLWGASMRELDPHLQIRPMPAAPTPARTGKPLYNTTLFKKPPYQGDVLS